MAHQFVSVVVLLALSPVAVATAQVPEPDPLAAHVPEGYRVEIVLKDLTYPTSVEFDTTGSMYVVEAGYSYGDPSAVPRILRVDRNGAISTYVRDGLNGPVPGEWIQLAIDDIVVERRPQTAEGVLVGVDHRDGVVAVLEASFQDQRHRRHAAVRMLLEAARRLEPVLAQEEKRRGRLVALRAHHQLLRPHLRGGAARDGACNPGNGPLPAHCGEVAESGNARDHLASSAPMIRCSSCGVLPSASKPYFWNVACVSISESAACTARRSSPSRAAG